MHERGTERGEGIQANYNEVEEGKSDKCNFLD